MHKDELIQLHTLLCQMKNYFEGQTEGNPNRFADYAAYGVSPQHIHKSKSQHKKAVFLLGKELAELVMVEGEGPSSARVVERFSRLAAKAGGEFIEPRREMGILVH
ncbi:MAG: UPF0058 family protein [Euryarchaeota archaeon]|nr:UPF0058 family protein [Euryarchaeota archaeon]